MSADVALKLDKINKSFRVYSDRPSSLKQLLSARARLSHRESRVLHDVSLDVIAGTTTGILGHNGSGKSTLLRIMAGIYKPSSGTVAARGQVVALMELGAGFHPEFTGRDNIYLNGALMGLTRAQIRQRFDSIVDFSGIGDFIDRPVKHYSSGMYVRLGFAVAVNVDADIILIDEVIAVGDAEFQRRCREHIKGLATSGRTIVVVSHSLSDIRELSDSVVWLDHGKIVASGEPERVTNDYVKAVTGHAPATSGSEGPVRIESITFLDRTGNPIVQGITGDPLTVRLSYRAEVPVDRPGFRITFDHVTGAPITGVNSSLGTTIIDRIEGPGYIDYTVDSLPLLDGSYLISAWIYEKSLANTLDSRYRVDVLDVRGHSRDKRYGVIEMKGGWEVGG
jgi:ABC-type polysaccharide/polyol phosphate transport system ATPase subunit